MISGNKGKLDSKLKRRSDRISSVELIDQSLDLLCHKRLALLPLYYCGAIPFMSALVFFINEMSFSVFAASNCLPWAVILSFLFIWKNYINSLFCRKIFIILCTGAKSESKLLGEKLSLLDHFRLISAQSLFQSAALIARPISLIFFTSAWTGAFFNTLCAESGIERGSIMKSLSKSTIDILDDSWKLNCLQYVFICIFGMTALNVGIIILLMPNLLKSVLGIDTPFSLSSGISNYISMVFNTSFISIVIAISLLFLDPIVKTVFTVRFFYAESQSKAYDISHELSEIREEKAV